MFELVFDSLKKATEVCLQTQQETFKRWMGAWPGVPKGPGPIPEQVHKFQKKWAEFYEETLKKQREAIEVQFKAGLKYIEDAFRLAESKDPAELRAKTIELWQKTFECLRQTYEAQTRDFQNAVGKWTELVARGKAE